jgi:hypothetical protein
MEEGSGVGHAARGDNEAMRSKKPGIARVICDGCDKRARHAREIRFGGKRTHLCPECIEALRKMDKSGALK